MEVSVLFVVVAVILAGFVLYGYRKGLVRVVFSLVSTFLAIALAMWMTPYVSEVLETKTSIYQSIQDKCVENLQLKAEEQVQQHVEEEGSVEIAGIELPEKWQQYLNHKTTEKTDDFLETSGIYEEIGDYVAGKLVNIMACVITFIMVGIILRVLFNILNIVSRLPVIKNMNQLGGIIAGAAEGVIIVWILFCIITICQTSKLGQELLKDINQNQFLKLLYENNVIQYILMRVIL